MAATGYIIEQENFLVVGQTAIVRLVATPDGQAFDGSERFTPVLTPDGELDSNPVAPNPGDLFVDVLYTAASVGSKSIGFTNNKGWSNPSPLVATATPAITGYAIAVTGPHAVGQVDAVTVKVTPDGAIFTSQPHFTLTATPDGTFGGQNPVTTQPSTGSPSFTRSYTPASNGLKSIAATNDGGIPAPAQPHSFLVGDEIAEAVGVLEVFGADDLPALHVRFEKVLVYTPGTSGRSFPADVTRPVIVDSGDDGMLNVPFVPSSKYKMRRELAPNSDQWSPWVDVVVPAVGPFKIPEILGRSS